MDSAITSLECFPFPVDALRVPASPFLERFPKGMCRHDVFPFQALGAFGTLLHLVATTCQADLFAGVRAATIEGGFMAGVDLSSSFLGFVEGQVENVL